MPRPLVYGNGSFLIQADHSALIRDLYYPYVGQWNHLAGRAIRTGFWVAGHFAWLEDHGWQRSLLYEEDVLIGSSVLTHPGLGIKVELREALHPEKPYFVRQFRVIDLHGSGREVRLFTNQPLCLAENDIGDTAMWRPELHGATHFKHRHAAYFGGPTVDAVTTGMKDFDAHEGSWLDAMDGELGWNPIAQGSCDSTVRYLARKEGDTQVFDAWIAMADSLDDLADCVTELRTLGTEGVIAASRQAWHDYSDELEKKLASLEESPRKLATRSLHLIHTQSDDRGAILAANDSDILKTNRATYSFLWPRDGALVAMALDQAGHPELSRAFLEFCIPLIRPDRRFLLHKYSPDGTLGATWHPWVHNRLPAVPMQQDETSLTILCGLRHLDATQDESFAARFSQEFLIPTLEFTLEHRDLQTGLPIPSWDLWEERHGIHAYTVATTIAALAHASERPQWIGEELAHLCKLGADAMRDGALEGMIHPSTGGFLRRLEEVPGGFLPDQTVDAATLAFGLFGALPWSHPVNQATLAAVRNLVEIKGGIGGVARYERDYYFRKVEHQPGNPWVICTMWLAQALIQQAQSKADLEEPKQWLRWAVDRADTTGVLSEQYHPDNGEPLSVSPLTWSHAEVLRTSLMLADRMREL